MTKVPQGVGPSHPQVVVLVGATGDLSKRKLLPGLFHLSNAGFIPGCRIIGVSLDELTVEAFRAQMRQALAEHSTRKVNDADWDGFAQALSYVPLTAGPNALNTAVQEAERSLGKESRRLIATPGQADSTDSSRGRVCLDTRPLAHSCAELWSQPIQGTLD